MTEQVDSAVVMANFAEKLGALRTAMTAVEQSMLDQMVANAEFDVNAHGLATYRVREAAATGAVADPAIISLERAAALEKAQSNVDDVEAHALQQKITYEFKVDSAVGYRVARLGTERIANDRHIHS